jgi:hypothetical protein
MAGRFAFKLGDRVSLKMSDEQGFVIGRAEYEKGVDVNRYYVRYVNADGRQVESWFDATAIELVYGNL